MGNPMEWIFLNNLGIFSSKNFKSV